MAQPITADYHTQLLLPPNLEDWLPKDHPVRYLREFVDGENLVALGFKDQFQPQEGRPGYAYSLLLKCLLYGYLNRIRSFRGLEKACKENVALIWLTGMHYPDHNAFWRFWHQYHRQIRALFLRSVQLAGQMGLVGYGLYAVDGTKIQAASSGRTAWSPEQVVAQLKHVEEQITQLEQELAQQALAPEGATYRLPAELSERSALRERLQQAKQALEAAQGTRHQPREPEARMMDCEDRKRLSYNGQAVADAHCGVIVAAAVTTQANDQAQLGPMIEQAQANTGHLPPEVVADSGYAVGDQLTRTQAMGTQVITPSPTPHRDQQPYHVSHFHYDGERQQLTCPQGQVLALEAVRIRAGRGWVRRYRCPHPDCSVRGQCTRDPKGRLIEIGSWSEVLQRQRQKLQDPHYQRQLRRRGTIIEPVFARIKERWGFRRWSYRGLDKVSSQWALLCLVSNLSILWHRRTQRAR